MGVARALKDGVWSRDGWRECVADSDGSSGLARAEASVRFRIRLKSPLVL